MYYSQIQLNKAEIYQYYLFSSFSDYNGFKFAVVRLSYDELLHFIFLSKIPTGKYLLMSFVLSSCRVFTTYFKTPNILKQLTKPLNFIESWFVFLSPISREGFIFNSISMLPSLRFSSCKIVKRLYNLCCHCDFIFLSLNLRGERNYWKTILKWQC